MQIQIADQGLNYKSMVSIKSGKQFNIWLTKWELYQLWYSIDEDVHGKIVFTTKDFTGSTGRSDFLISSTLLIPDTPSLQN